MLFKSKKNLKFTFLIAGQFVVALFLVFRLFQIQILDHNKYKVMAEDQYFSTKEIPPKRGDILSKNNYPLATTQKAYLLYANPDRVENTDMVSEKIAEVVVEHKKDFYENKAQKSALFYTYKKRYNDVLNLDLKWAVLEHYLPQDAYKEIKDLNILGLGFEEEPRRFYPEGTLASHILGFVGKNSEGKEQGYFGVEGYLNGDLKGRPGRVIEELDATGDPILIGGYKRVDPVNGRDIVLTINRAVQYLVEKRLKEGVRKYGALSGSVIVMNPKTGEIIAMANYPTYHPARFNEDIYNEYSKIGTLEIDSDNNKDIAEEDSADDLASSDGDSGRGDVFSYTPTKDNSAIAKAYEPGSVMKPLTVAAGIDLKIITPQTTFNDDGPVFYSGYMIDNWDGKHHGVQNIIQLLQKSNNVGAAWVGHKVGRKNLYNYFESFGIGGKTNVSLEGENGGILRNYKNWTDIDLANNAFGQGVSATPLQILNAFNLFANEGIRLKPRIVSKFIENEKVIEVPTEVVGRVVSKSTANTMVQLLEKAVAGGESRYFNINDYKISGKTGTAEIAVKGNYIKGETNATFAGFPTVSKRFSMIVKLERPSTSIYASETAVPLWMNIASDLINFYDIPPDKN